MRETQPPSVAEVSIATGNSELGNPSGDDNPEEMGGLRNRLLCRFVSSTCFQMNRRKTLGENLMETPLRRCLSTLDITMLGIGHMVGAGIYVLTGTVAHNMAGPAIVLSFLIAGLASVLAALCYAEFGSRVPKAGSAYVYTYVTIGEFWAFVIGWNILLEHMIGAASVARAWSGYVDALAGGVIANATAGVFGEMHNDMMAKTPDFLAFGVCLAYCGLSTLGVKGSSYFNSFFTMVNIGVIVFVSGFGFYWADYHNWTDYGGFAPFGFSGILSGAATCFYAYVGFDSIATSGEEARDPSFSIPVATFVSMSVVSLGYMCVSAALTLMVPYTLINPTAALPDAFASHGITWARIVISIGALAGMTTTLFGSLFSLPRGVYAMAQDGLLFKVFARVNEKTQVPLITIGVCGLFSAIVALFFDIEKLVEFMSIGTLMAYTIVSAAVIILRYRPLVSKSDVLPLTETPTSPGSAKEFVDMLNEAGRLKPKFYWIERILGSYEPGVLPATCVFIFTVSCSCIFAILQWGGRAVYHPNGPEWWLAVLLTFLVAVSLITLVLIAVHNQSTEGLRFKVPWVPTLPALSIAANVALMVNLNPMTWIRFAIWMSIGFVIYFAYGMRHSKENAAVSSYSGLLKSNSRSGEWGSTLTAKDLPSTPSSQTEN